MRITPFLPLAASLILAGCTVKDVDAPPFAGPSTLSQSIVMVADRNTLTQNGVDFTDIRITALSPEGQSLSVPLRAQVYVDNAPADFGTLSTKTPTAPTTLRYTAPPASTLAGGQVPTTVTIAVTPATASDFRGEFARQVDIHLVPQGVILPSNPNLVASFQVSTANPSAFQTVTFDAAATTNNGSACATLCSYAWNFGDGNTSSGVTTTHVYRSVGIFNATLTVTDARGAQAVTSRPLTVATPAQPTGAITTSPTTNISTDIDVFFNATGVTWNGRTITNYSWSFGDGTSGSGLTTTHRYRVTGTFTVTLTVTDSMGAQGTVATTVTVTTLGGATANLTASTLTPRVNARVIFDATGSIPSAGARIVSYRFIYGDLGEETTDSPIQSHVYVAAGTYTVTLVVTDSNGKTATRSLSVTVSP